MSGPFSKSIVASDYDYVIDVREIDEWNAGHYLDAIHTPLTDLMKGVDSFDRTMVQKTSNNLISIKQDVKLLILCRSGMRASQAKKLLTDAGYQNVTVFTKSYDKL